MKIARHAQIIKLISQYDIETQEELAQKLEESGFAVTQATISRDIRQLKLTKVPKENGGFRYAVLQNTAPEMGARYVRVLKEAFVSGDVGKVGQQIFGRYQIQLLERAYAYSVCKVVRRRLHMRKKVADKIPHAFLEQVAYRLVVQIKRGAVDAGSRAKLLYCDIFDVLLLEQLEKRLIHTSRGAVIFAFGSIQAYHPCLGKTRVLT